MIARIARIAPNPSFPGAYLLTVRCRACGELHQHGVDSGEFLLGVPVHRSAGEHCQAPHRDPDRKGLRKEQRVKIKRDKALYDESGGSYYIPLYIALYAEVKDDQLVGLRLGEMRKMRVRSSASQEGAKV